MGLCGGCVIVGLVYYLIKWCGVVGVLVEVVYVFCLYVVVGVIIVNYIVCCIGCWIDRWRGEVVVYVGKICVKVFYYYLW